MALEHGVEQGAWLELRAGPDGRVRFPQNQPVWIHGARALRNCTWRPVALWFEQRAAKRGSFWWQRSHSLCAATSLWTMLVTWIRKDHVGYSNFYSSDQCRISGVIRTLYERWSYVLPILNYSRLDPAILRVTSLGWSKIWRSDKLQY
jgi:hypothetical protein